MKLRNKKTGEIINLLRGELSDDCGDTIVLKPNDDHEFCYRYNSLTELNEEWEDMPEEQKEYWYINEFGTPTEVIHTRENLYDKSRKNFGNYFETEEEAEKAVEKLKAWKRLKDKGFRFTGVEDAERTIRFEIPFRVGYDSCEAEADLNLLFGGEE